MEGLMAMLSQFNQAMARVEQLGTQPPPPKNNMATLDQFMRQRPPIFSRCTDPIKAEEWLASMEKIFRDARMAIYRLEGDANRWWEEIEAIRTPEEIQEVDWEEFK